MILFSKIYSCYYQIVTHILSLALEQGTITYHEINEIIDLFGFKESSLYLLPKLTSKEWSFLHETQDGVYSSNIRNRIKAPLSGLQKSFMKTMLQDPKILLFLSHEEQQVFEEQLRDIKPLFLLDDIYYFDQCRDGDPFESFHYQNNFKMVLKAIKKGEILTITYNNKALTQYDLIPFQIQYSLKDNKFRVDCAIVYQQCIRHGITMDMGNIQSCRISNITVALEDYIDQLKLEQRAEEPIIIEISGERNSLERCMMHFASYQKRTEYNEKNKTYICTIYYEKRDEEELLVQVLSFGPVIRVLGSRAFLNKVKERVNRQHELFSRDI